MAPTNWKLTPDLERKHERLDSERERLPFPAGGVWSLANKGQVTKTDDVIAGIDKLFDSMQGALDSLNEDAEVLDEMLAPPTYRLSFDDDGEEPYPPNPAA